MKPLIAKWRGLGIATVVFYDDGMAVGPDECLMTKTSLQMQCDLLRAGLVPGIKKCQWLPQQLIDWNGLRFDFLNRKMSILPTRINATILGIEELLNNWPLVTFRDISRTIGRIVSMHPVFEGKTQIRTKMLQTFVNIRVFKNLSWDDKIQANFMPLFGFAKDELHFWPKFLMTHNFRHFELKKVNWLAWTDASEIAVAGFAVKLIEGTEKNAFTADNLLRHNGFLHRTLSRCVPLQADLMPWHFRKHIAFLDAGDLNPRSVEIMAINHRNLEKSEKRTSSTERELIAALHFLISMVRQLHGKVVTLHLDSQNAVDILAHGSSKPNLNKYAVLCFQLCIEYDITVHWIPRSSNNVADSLSTMFDFDDFGIRRNFFGIYANISA